MGVLDVSAGGFAILADRPIQPGESFAVEFQLASRPLARLRANCVHCSRATANGSARYRAGFAFVSVTVDEARALARLIDDVSGALPMG